MTQKNDKTCVKDGKLSEWVFQEHEHQEELILQVCNGISSTTDCMDTEMRHEGPLLIMAKDLMISHIR